eukprot:TRINITY_DN40484_c0_g1_i1.p1 TRINITY_DN40484_c0_g1~~TRINITY_DN40484_c0_g1_i1.p1  ORF type:complete len:322 (+),score=-3.52 TRINITY_DN40484_c0_g1_i1:19-984(+)
MDQTWERVTPIIMSGSVSAIFCWSFRNIFSSRLDAVPARQFRTLRRYGKVLHHFHTSGNVARVTFWGFDNSTTEKSATMHVESVRGIHLKTPTTEFWTTTTTHKPYLLSLCLNAARAVPSAMCFTVHSDTTFPTATLQFQTATHQPDTVEFLDLRDPAAWTWVMHALVMLLLGLVILVLTVRSATIYQWRYWQHCWHLGRPVTILGYNQCMSSEHFFNWLTEHPVLVGGYFGCLVLLKTVAISLSVGLGCVLAPQLCWQARYGCQLQQYFARLPRATAECVLPIVSSVWFLTLAAGVVGGSGSAYLCTTAASHAGESTPAP